jgi:p-aminobenzoyl-glutamate transporter AbgT
VGDELPNLFLIAIAIAIIMMILTSLLNESEQRTRRERTLNFLQIEAETEPGSVRTRGIVGGVAEKQGSGNRG